MRALTLAILLAGCASPLPATVPDTPVVVQDPAACTASCNRAQAACAKPGPVDSCVETCQQAAPDLEGPIDDLTKSLTCSEAP
jgi:PBP1b-binding outer membrane lipoprotein LpoB